MKNHRAKSLLVVPLVLGIALPAAAIIYPLSAIDIRDAFMTAQRNDEQTADFFLPYSHSVPMPAKGPHVAIVSIATPFSQVVERTGKPNYHSNEAEEDFLGKPLDFIVRVQIDYTATYPEPIQGGPLLTIVPIPDFTRDFKIQLAQDKNENIPPKSERVFLIFSDASADLYGAAGAILELRYDPEKIDSDLTTVKVDTPDGQHVETTFNLLRLR